MTLFCILKCDFFVISITFEKLDPSYSQRKTIRLYALQVIVPNLTTDSSGH